MGASLVYLNEPNKEIEHEHGHSDKLRFVTGSMQGWRLNMEDSHIANVKYMGSKNKSLFGVFDGHGGREVAIFCQNHYQDILEKGKAMENEGNQQEWMRQSFLHVDDEIRTQKGQEELGDLRRDQPPKKPAILNILGEAQKGAQPDVMAQLDSIGCTSNVIYLDHEKGKMFVANAGDSRCVLGKNRKAVELSIDHKPECQIEIDRITKAGSVITDGRVDGNLNLTRSLGDLKYKHRQNLKPEEQAITANPDTYEFEMDDEWDFIIMGCDGIWEKKSNEEMVAWIYEGMDKQKKASPEKEVDLQAIVADLLLETIADDVVSSGGVGCDNMTCILIEFNKN